MKHFEQAETAGYENYFGNEGFSREEANVGGLTFTFWVLPQGLNPSLTDFAFRSTYVSPGTYEVFGLFGVSDSVPEELRKYWAAHEVIEFTQIGIDTVGRCQMAEEWVLSQIPSDLRDEYISRRIHFFQNLIEFFKSASAVFTQDDIAEAQASLDYLLQQSQIG